MTYTISVFTETTFKELFLPSISDADYTLILERKDFGLPESISVKMEVINGKWTVFAAGYKLLQNNEIKDKIHFRQKNSFKLITDSGLEFSFVAIESDRSIETIGKYNIEAASQITIGKGNDMDIKYEGIGLVSRKHATLINSNGVLYLEDNSLNGTFVGMRRISGRTRLYFGDCINVFGLHIVVLNNMIAINASYGDVVVNTSVLSECKENSYCSYPAVNDYSEHSKHFHRSPRNMPAIVNDTVVIEAAPSPKNKQERPLWMTIGPSMTMALPMLLGCSVAVISMNGSSSAFMYTGIITAVVSAIIGVIWAILNMKYAKKTDAEEELNRFERYSDYLVNVADDLKHKYQENYSALYQMYPSALDCVQYTRNSPQLWNRNKTHNDFLYHRLGIGNMDFQVEINAPKEKFTIISDELAAKPQMIKESYKTLKNVPVGVDLLKNHLIGIIGNDNSKSAIEISRTLAVQIAANNCYTDVKMVFVYDGTDREIVSEWNFAKWLPHIWSEDKRTRYLATDKNEAGDIFYELAKVIRTRAEEHEENKISNDFPKPYYILFISNPEILDGELISKYIFSNEDYYGMTTILLTDTYENLPNACEEVIEKSSAFSGIYSMTGGRQTGRNIDFDSVSAYDAEIFARRLLSIEVKEIENGGEIPTSLSFFDMYNVTSLEEFQILDRWRKNRTYDSMKALIGKKSGDSDCYLDIHEKYHGPHGLVAGTTGSGKSETLQTYILSLALNYSPEDVSFFIIDFKGGGMANLFDRLPHMVGQISNLSGNQIRRAMLSIKSENLRRQRIFSEYGVNNINSYTRLVKNKEAQQPLPHLFIIIDEFAELKREEPEFMRELISVAQVGRSLGVHLILATQKPSGTVDDNIWSNSKFKLCLRVQDRQDSFDMLHRHDAAYLTNSGRCYLQVGNDEIFELFQSGWSGAVYDENMSNRADIAIMFTNTGKTAVVGNRIKHKQKENAREKFLSLIAAHLINSVSSTRISESELFEGNENIKTVVSNAFETINNTDLDYANTKYNSQRLEDYLKLLLSCKDENLSVMVKNAIQEAKRLGIKLPEYKDKTQLDAVVEYISDIALKNSYKKAFSLWMPLLPEMIALDELPQYIKFDKGWSSDNESFSLNTVIGLCDDPENQNQFSLNIDFAENGNHAVCGMVVSGKSTFIQTVLFALISKYSPDQLNIYAIDFSSKMLACFENAPHFGGVMFENDNEKIAKFFNMLEKELDNRKSILKGGSFSQYKKLESNDILPAIIIAIDNYANFREKTNNAYDDIMLRLSRDGVGYGIYLLISAAGLGAIEIPNRMADNIRTVMCLEMGDKFKYMDTLHISHIDVMPEEDIKGRGIALVAGNVLEFQTAVALRSDDDYKRNSEIESTCLIMDKLWSGRKARKIPQIPEHPVWSDFAQSEDYKTQIKNDSLLPFAYNSSDAAVYSLNLSEIYCYILTGFARTGKTNCLKNMILSAKDQNANICVIDNSSNELKTITEKVKGKYVQGAKQMYEYWTELIPIFKERNALKRQLLAEGCDDEQIFLEMKNEKRIYIFISDFTDFIKTVYAPEAGVGMMNGFLENILEKGSLHNIYFIGCLNCDDISSLSGYALYNIIASYKSGIHFGGNVFKQRLFDFSAIPFAEQSKAYKPGIGLISGDDNGVVKIVAPDSRR